MPVRTRTVHGPGEEDHVRLDELTDSAVDYIINNIDEDALGEWEQAFFRSVADRWQATRQLSEKQRLKLGEVWDRQS